jgi:hypothetical protein
MLKIMKVFISFLLPITTRSFVLTKHHIMNTPSTRIQVLFPNKKGIIVEPDGDFIARDPLIDDFMGRRSSANDVLRNDNVPRGEPQSVNPLQNAVNDDYMDPYDMRVQDIQYELQQRNIFYGDCFDRDSLVMRLKEARREILWEESLAGADEMNQESPYSYEGSEQNNNYGWGDQSAYQSDQESSYSYNDITDQTIGESNEHESVDTPFENSGRWVYDNPVPPNMPPPEYFDSSNGSW